MSAWRYALDEALVSLRRNARSVAISVATIAVAFLTLGGFLVALANIEAAAARWAQAAELSVYLRDGIDETTRTTLARDLGAHAAVAEVSYVSKDDALQRFRQDFPELSDVAGSLDTNPFPASLEVRLRPEAATADTAQTLAGEVGGRDGVADVQFDQRWIARVLALVSGVRLLGLGIGAVLLTGAAFTVAAVVRLSLVARQDELDIMALVGAPFAFVRGPFIAEGMLQGLAGASVALVALRVVFSLARGGAGDDLAGLLGTGQLRFLGVGAGFLLLAAGLAVGGVAGIAASRPTPEARFSGPPR
jgi:cell division transport system permease protein